MNSLPFYFLINLTLVTRLFSQFRDRPVSKSTAIGKTSIEILGLLVFQFNFWLLLLVPGIMLINGWSFYSESRNGNLNLKRVISLVLYALLFGLFFASHFGMKFNRQLLQGIDSLASFHLGIKFLTGIDWHFALIVLFGFLLSLNEANLFIRYFFEVMDLVPLKLEQSQSGGIDIREYNRGRVIGFLERVMIFFFVLNGHYSAMGFILAAKGITRFKKLEERTFAEYFLIGTLLSAVVAGAIALLTKKLL